MTDTDESGWQAFIAGLLYPPDRVPWRHDPAFAVIAEHAGLRDSVGGDVARALYLTLHMVRATARVDLQAVVRARRPALGVCLGFGMHALEPYDLLQVFDLDCVHAYEWIGEQVVEAAQTLQALRSNDASLPQRIRLHHNTLSDLSALGDSSVRLIYAANVFNAEIPMLPKTLNRAIQEILRVLADRGVVILRGSSGKLEPPLVRHGRMLLQTPLASVFQKLLS